MIVEIIVRLICISLLEVEQDIFLKPRQCPILFLLSFIISETLEHQQNSVKPGD